jgi:hypothetical protein
VSLICDSGHQKRKPEIAPPPWISPMVFDSNPAPAQTGNKSRGTNILGVRAFNQRLVLSLVRRFGNLPKAEIARLTGLSAQTVSVIVKALEGDGLLPAEVRSRLVALVREKITAFDLQGLTHRGVHWRQRTHNWRCESALFSLFCSTVMRFSKEMHNAQGN